MMSIADQAFTGMIMGIVMMPMITFYLLDFSRDEHHRRDRRKVRSRRQQPKQIRPVVTVNAAAAVRDAQLKALRLGKAIDVYKRTKDRRLLSRILVKMRELGIDTRRLDFNGPAAMAM